jgi:hypothetical protein
VKVDDFADPQQRTTSLQNMTVNCAIATAGRQSTLTVHVPAAVVGHIDLLIEALVSEKFVSPSTQTSGSEMTTANTEIVRWEERYTNDRDACRKAWNDLIRRFEISKEIPIVFTLPDPPPEYERAVRYLAAVDHALAAAHEHAPAAAAVIEQAIAMTLNLTPTLLRQIAQRASSGAPALSQE